MVCRFTRILRLSALRLAALASVLACVAAWGTGPARAGELDLRGWCRWNCASWPRAWSARPPSGPPTWNAPQPTLAACDPHTLVRQALLERAPAAAANGVRLRHANTRHHVRADPAMLERIVVIGAVCRAVGRDLPSAIVTGDTTPDRLRALSGLCFPVLHKPIRPGNLASLSRHLLHAPPQGVPGGSA